LKVHGRVDLRNVSIPKAEFDDVVDVDGSKVSGALTLQDCKIHELRFSGATIDGDVTIASIRPLDVSAPGLVNAKAAHINGCLRVSDFSREIELGNATITEGLTLSNLPPDALVFGAWIKVGALLSVIDSGKPTPLVALHRHRASQGSCQARQ
jgi:hypothetical protein